MYQFLKYNMTYLTLNKRNWFKITYFTNLNKKTLKQFTIILKINYTVTQ